VTWRVHEVLRHRLLREAEVCERVRAVPVDDGIARWLLGNAESKLPRAAHESDGTPVRKKHEKLLG